MKEKALKYNLPKGWCSASLKEVSLSIKDGSHNPPKKQERGIPMLSAQNIENGFIKFDKVRLISEEDFTNEDERTRIRPGDVLITTVATIGRVAIVPDRINKPFTLQRSVSVIKPLINGRYLMYCCQSPLFQKLLSINSKGTAQKGVYLNTLRSLPIPIPPQNEQARIAIKLEELFSELDHSIENFKLAYTQLKIYRQTLLKNAFEGKLTEEWRKENNPEPAERLLGRIKEERQTRYKQEFTDWKTKTKKWEKEGKKKDKPKPPEKIKNQEPPNKSEIADMNEIPSSWLYIKMGQICNVVRGGSPRPAGDPRYYGGDIPFMKVADITKDSRMYVSTTQHTITKEGLRKTRHIPIRTLLLSNSGATLGVPKITLFETTFNDGIAAFLDLIEELKVFYYYYWYSQTEIIRDINQGAAQPNLNTTIISGTMVPLCPIAEAKFLIDEIESQFSIIDQLEETITSSLNKSETLRKSILRKAFEGKLVNQNPTDIPAIEFLQHIEAKKKKYLEEQKIRKKKATKKPEKMSQELSIEDVLKTSNKPMLAKEVWQHSKHKENIEDFYAELKKIQNKVWEVKKGTESMLSLAK